MHEFPYLQWQMEVHRAKLKAAYPHAADKIQLGGPIEADDVYARATRVSSLARHAHNASGRRVNEFNYVFEILDSPVVLPRDRRKARPRSAAEIIPRRLLRRVRRRNLLRIAQRNHGRSLARPARIARRRTEPPRGRQLAGRNSGALQHALEYPSGNVRVRHPSDLRRSASAGFRRATTTNRRTRRALSRARETRPAASSKFLPAGPGASPAGHATPSSRTDGPHLAISHGPVPRGLRRRNGIAKNRHRLRHGARSSPRPFRFSVAQTEIVLRRPDAHGRGLFPQKSPRRRRNSACWAKTASSAPIGFASPI